MDCRLIVVSCPARKPLQEIWKKCHSEAWPDCPFPVTILSPEDDLGWNANLIRCLESIDETYVLLMLDDNFLEPSPHYTANIRAVLELMSDRHDIAMVKLQAGGAHAPEIPFPAWPRIREYDRRHHPFKRTNLIPCMYRRSWLLRLSRAVLSDCGPERDKGRSGAIEFEMTGTKLTCDAANWPERMFGIHRPEPDGSGGDSLLVCYGNDAVTGGKIRPFLSHLCDGVAGAEVYL
jgi:hypothetical protein